MTVRTARPHDDPELAALRRALRPDDDGDTPGEACFVWERADGGLGGFVSCSVRPWAEGCTSSPVAYVEGWYVTAELRRQGIGRSLMAAVENWASAQGLVEIGSDARVDNRGSRLAHRRLGFEPTERVQYYRRAVGAAPRPSVVIQPHRGDRAGLRWLFELAEDAAPRIDAAIGRGRVLVAKAGHEIVGLVHVTETVDPTVAEILHVAVRPRDEGHGIGSRLIEAALGDVHAHLPSVTTMEIATATAGTDLLGLYQRLGFRFARIEHDAFTAADGYPTDVLADSGNGIPLRDRIVLRRPLD